MSEDVLSGLLRRIRLRGALFFNVECVGDWVTEAPASMLISSAVMPTSDHMMEYHILLGGTCWAGITGEPQFQMNTGDVVLFPHGDPHVMSSVPGLRAEPDLPFLMANLKKRDGLPFMVRQQDDRHIQPAKPCPETVSDQTCATLLCGEAVLERMSEMMFVDLIRLHLSAMPESQTGWLAALRDRHVGRVLSVMHGQPAEAWTLEKLSSHAGMSRSALQDRFVELVGQPPMQYLRCWRMQVAANLLVESHAKLITIAREVGYESEEAFSRTFKRAVGQPPAMWRRERSLQQVR